MLYRHGDVLIEKINALPGGKSSNERRKLQHTILAHGEVTGHSHRIQETGAAELFHIQGTLYLRVIGEVATVVHEEHRPIALPTGDYRVWRQREYSPRENRIVRD